MSEWSDRVTVEIVNIKVALMKMHAGDPRFNDSMAGMYRVFHEAERAIEAIKDSTTCHTCGHFHSIPFDRLDIDMDDIRAESDATAKRLQARVERADVDTGARGFRLPARGYD